MNASHMHCIKNNKKINVMSPMELDSSNIFVVVSDLDERRELVVKNNHLDGVICVESKENIYVEGNFSF